MFKTESAHEAHDENDTPGSKSEYSATVLELLPIGACVFDDALIVHEWNQKLVEWTGLGKSDVLGTCLADHFPNLLESRYSGRLKQVFSTGMPAKYSAALHKRFLPVAVRHGLNGMAGDFMVQETEVRMCSTMPKLALCTIQDFSFQYGQLCQLKKERAELVGMKEQLEKTNGRLAARNEELDEFCHVASHDLQDPLGRLITLGQLMEQQSRENLDPQGLRCLNGMLGSSRQMRSIIIDLLALSRASQLEPNLESLFAYDCANIAVEVLAKRINERDARIEFDLEMERAPKVVGDVMLLSKVYQNLISNSLKFVPLDRRPIIRLTAELDGQHWRFGVVDNGTGIDEAILDKVFRPFEQFGSDSDEEGSGVGLTICRNAIKRMGGEISIESNAGEGCSVSFKLSAAGIEDSDGLSGIGEVPTDGR